MKRLDRSQRKKPAHNATQHASLNPPEQERTLFAAKTDRRPDCVTEIRMGNSVLTVSGFFKQGATDTAADKMMKVLEAEAATQKTAI